MFARKLAAISEQWPTSSGRLPARRFGSVGRTIQRPEWSGLDRISMERPSRASRKAGSGFGTRMASPRQPMSSCRPNSDLGPLSADGGRHVWNQVDQPMVLMILPPTRTLTYVDPKPICDGVWECNGRLCLFWGAPLAQTSYAFALGSPADALARNAKRWKRRTRSFRPTSRRQVLLGFVISLLIIFLVAGFIALRGQAEAGAWVGTGAAVVSLFITVMQLLNTRQPNTGGLSNPA
jgi:hypothetical protein